MGLSGRWVWHDLSTADLDAAEAFYTQVVGWGTESWQGSSAEAPYLMWTAPGGSVGGLMQLSEDAQKSGTPPHWLGYIATDDLDATVARATELGATLVVAPTEILGAGRFAVLQDPQQTAFALFASSREGELKQGPGWFSWGELYTSDWGSAFDFYSALFGWVKSGTLDMGGGETYQMFKLEGDENSLGGMMNRPAEIPVNAWLNYVTVADLDAALDTVRQLGGQVISGPMEVPGGDRVATCVDPQGAVFALHCSP